MAFGSFSFTFTVFLPIASRKECSLFCCKRRTVSQHGRIPKMVIENRRCWLVAGLVEALKKLLSERKWIFVEQRVSINWKAEILWSTRGSRMITAIFWGIVPLAYLWLSASKNLIMSFRFPNLLTLEHINTKSALLSLPSIEKSFFCRINSRGDLFLPRNQPYFEITVL